jgi:hypothetical protein
MTKPKLGLPKNKPAAPPPPEPDRQPGYGAELAEIITAEIRQLYTLEIIRVGSARAEMVFCEPIF